jgi:hypothetical protein
MQLSWQNCDCLGEAEAAQPSYQHTLHSIAELISGRRLSQAVQTVSVFLYSYDCQTQNISCASSVNQNSAAENLPTPSSSEPY